MTFASLNNVGLNRWEQIFADLSSSLYVTTRGCNVLFILLIFCTDVTSRPLHLRVTVRCDFVCHLGRAKHIPQPSLTRPQPSLSLMRASLLGTGETGGLGFAGKVERKKERLTTFLLPITPCAPLGRASLVNINRRQERRLGTSQAAIHCLNCGRKSLV